MSTEPHSTALGTPHAIWLAVAAMALLVHFDALAQDRTQADIEPTWSKVYQLDAQAGPPEPASVVLADSARCVAVAANGVIEVLDRGGALMWRWEYRHTNRYITPGAIAVSPSCDAVAIVGEPGYRYTWVATRNGQRVPLATTSTPLTAAFDQTGRHVAIGTGGSDVVLFTRAGQLQWKITLHCCVVQRLSFSDDNRSILIQDSGIGVVRIDGTVAWTSRENGMNASRDLRTFVAWAEPNHGPGIGHVAALDANGEPIWTRLARSPEGIISPSGDKIIAWINNNQKPSEAEFLRSSDEQPASLQVLSRNGAVVATLPVASGGPIAMSDDGQILLQTSTGLDMFDVYGNVTLSIPIQWSGPWQTMVSRDFNGAVFVGRNGREVQVRWYVLR